MTPDDLARIESTARQQSGKPLAHAIALMPGSVLELFRLAKIGMGFEAAANEPRPLHQDDGA